MEARRHWNILIVDDEPDIHEVTELTLKREKVFGAPLKLHHANSAKEAREFFEKNEAGMALAVAFVDVVMETDDAGLQLCRWIREERGEHVTQLILRTGQPGKAPPRQVIDDYNVSGYLTKIEATGDRLYMSLKTAIQEYYNLQYLFWSAELYDAARAKCESPEVLYQVCKVMMSQPPKDALGFQTHRGMDFFGKRYLGQGAFADKQAYDKVKDDLMKRGANDLAKNGVAVVDNHVIVQTRVVGTQEIATLIVRDAVYPRSLTQLYGSVWRQSLAYLAEVYHRAS